MKPKKRQKLCYNCEGDVDLDVIVCPFCAADLRIEKPERAFFSSSAHSVKHLSGEALEVPETRYEKVRHEEASPLLSEEEEEEGGAAPTRPVWLGLVLFVLGAQLFLLAFLLLFFQSAGAVVLKWDARFWFLYLFASIPLLILGYRALPKEGR